MKSTTIFSGVFVFLRTTVSFAHPQILNHFLNLRDNDANPADLSNIKSFAAIGDSYAAGIGAGKVVDSGCSRYDDAYPALMQRLAFGGKPKFTFLACSGDKSEKVIDQAKKLEKGSQDLITVSAGGNDVLLTDVLKACVYLPGNQGKCDQALKDTEAAIDKDLEKGVDDLLTALQDKLSPQGVAIYTLYAQFFNADTDACTKQTWGWFTTTPGVSGVKLTKENRKKMNDLVLKANKKISTTIASQAGSTRPHLNVVIAEWDQVVSGSKGRFCEEGSLHHVANSCQTVD